MPLSFRTGATATAAVLGAVLIGSGAIRQAMHEPAASVAPPQVTAAVAPPAGAPPAGAPVAAAPSAGTPAMLPPASVPAAGAPAPATPPTGETAPEAETAEAVPEPEVRQSFGRAAGLHRTRDPLHLTSSAALAIDQDTGRVLVSKNAEAVLPIASLTKLMTAIIVLEAKLPLDQEITITADDVDNERNSRSRLRVGTTLTRSEALHLALMSSENRAAHALGRTFPGGVSQFVNAMNTKARQLKMRNTVFVDPTGLSTYNQSTAVDLATLSMAAAKYPVLREYSTTEKRQVELGGRTLLYNNSNRLVKSPQWDILLQKTGYIVEAGQCVAMNTRIAGQQVVIVLLDAGDKRSRSADAERIKRWVAAQAGTGSTMAAGKDSPRT